MSKIMSRLRRLEQSLAPQIIPQYRAITYGGAVKEELGAFTAGAAGMANYLATVGLDPQALDGLLGKNLPVDAATDPIIDFKNNGKKSLGPLFIRLYRVHKVPFILRSVPQQRRNTHVSG